MAFNEDEKLNTQVVIEETDKEVEQEEVVVETTGKSSNKRKAKKQSKVKGAFSELKKVTWPGFGSVVKKTAVVLSVTLVFLLIIIGIDQLLYLLVGLLTKKA